MTPKTCAHSLSEHFRNMMSLLLLTLGTLPPPPSQPAQLWRGKSALHFVPEKPYRSPRGGPVFLGDRQPHRPSASHRQLCPRLLRPEISDCLVPSVLHRFVVTFSGRSTGSSRCVACMSVAPLQIRARRHRKTSFLCSLVLVGTMSPLWRAGRVVFLAICPVLTKVESWG